MNPDQLFFQFKCIIQELYETDFFKDTYLKHQRIPLIRTGLAEDISGPACFLCSNDSDYITGQNLSVDGGISSIF